MCRQPDLARLGLTYNSRTASSLPTYLGAQFDGRFYLYNGMLLSPYARLSWVHEFERARDITATFIALPGGSFAVEGPHAAADAVRINIGSNLAVNRNIALFASFDGEFSNRSQSYAGKGGIQSDLVMTNVGRLNRPC